MSKSKIIYESDEKRTKIEVEATGEDLMKAVCRIAYQAKVQLEIPEDKFIDLVKDGMKVAELEAKMNESGAADKLDSIIELLEALMKREGKDD